MNFKKFNAVLGCVNGSDQTDFGWPIQKMVLNYVTERFGYATTQMDWCQMMLTQILYTYSGKPQFIHISKVHHFQRIADKLKLQISLAKPTILRLYIVQIRKLKRTLEGL
jgi:hypothetical protein